MKTKTKNKTKQVSNVTKKQAEKNRLALEAVTDLNSYHDIKISLNPELPKPVNLDKVLQDGIKASVTPYERSAIMRKNSQIEGERRRQEAKQNFLKEFGLEANISDDFVYEIAGLKWIAYFNYDIEERYFEQWVLKNVDTYQGILLGYFYVEDLKSLADVVDQVYERKAFLEKSCPDTIWGRFKRKILHGHIQDC